MDIPVEHHQFVELPNEVLQNLVLRSTQIKDYTVTTVVIPNNGFKTLIASPSGEYTDWVWNYIDMKSALDGHVNAVNWLTGQIINGNNMSK